MTDALLGAAILGGLATSILLAFHTVQKLRLNRYLKEALANTKEAEEKERRLRFFDTTCWMCGMECIASVSVNEGNDIPRAISCPECDMLMMEICTEVVPPPMELLGENKDGKED